MAITTTAVMEAAIQIATFRVFGRRTEPLKCENYWDLFRGILSL